MTSHNRPPAVEGPGPFEFEIEESDAPADCKRWRLKIEHNRLTVEGWNDARTWHDTLVLERRGPMLQVKLPAQADMREIFKKFPALELVAPIIVAKRRLVEAGGPGDMPPQLIHTKAAKLIWPIFGMRDECPLAGGASFFDVMAVWAPALDQFVSDPDAK
ncbi:MAG: hypothetical protein ACREI7_08075 [Myxococcota bacterium]